MPERDYSLLIIWDNVNTGCKSETHIVEFYKVARLLMMAAKFNVCMNMGIQQQATKQFSSTRYGTDLMQCHTSK